MGNETKHFMGMTLLRKYLDTLSNPKMELIKNQLNQESILTETCKDP